MAAPLCSRLRGVSRGGEAGQTKKRSSAGSRSSAGGTTTSSFRVGSGPVSGEPPAYDPIERWKLFEPYLPDDLNGKSVLDVGGNSGYFSLRMKQRGAGRCLMVEPILDFVDQAHFVFSQFGVEVETVNEDVHAYVLTTDERFDYVLFLGLFYHLKYPVLVLDRLAEMTRTYLLQLSHRGRPFRSPPPPWMKPRCPYSIGGAASLRGDWTRAKGPRPARSETWIATSSSQLHSLGCRSSKAPIAATSRTGGSRATRRSSRSLGARASRFWLARIRRRLSPNRSGISERPATASSSSRATARPRRPVFPGEQRAFAERVRKLRRGRPSGCPTWKHRLPSSPLSDEIDEVARQHALVDERLFVQAHEVDHRHVLRVVRVEVARDVREDELEQRAAEVGSEDDLKLLSIRPRISSERTDSEGSTL